MHPPYPSIHRIRTALLEQRPTSAAYFDFHRARHAQNALKKFKNNQRASPLEERAYFVHAPAVHAVADVSRDVFDRLYSQYGAGASQCVLIDDNLHRWLRSASNSEEILATGGACALESQDTKIIQYLQQKPNGETLIKKYIDVLLPQAPTWTQITGSLIPKEGYSVFYDETFPWYLRLEAYGIEDAMGKTRRVYDGVYGAVSRYVRLFSPNNKAIRVPFEDLDLNNSGKFSEWFDQARPYLQALEERFDLPHTKIDVSNYLKAWVEYTYIGPDIFSILRSTIQKNHSDLITQQFLDAATIHVRGKQIDHLDTERTNAWMHAVILGNDTAKLLQQRKHHLLTPYHRHAIALFEWFRDHYSAHTSIGFVGFLDQVIKGSIAHEQAAYSRSDLNQAIARGSFDEMIMSPMRLHAGNFTQTLRLLEEFSNPRIVSFSKELFESFMQTKNSLLKKKQKAKRIKQYIMIMKKVHSAIASHSCASRETHFKEKKADISIGELKFIQERYEKDEHISRLASEHSVYDSSRYLLSGACSFLQGAESISDEERGDIEQFLPYWQERITCDMQRYIEALTHADREIAELEETHQAMLRTVEKQISMQQHHNPYLKHVTILPLSDNLFVSYLSQLMFVPVLFEGLERMVAIESSDAYSHEEKEGILVQIMHQLFPHVRAIITYVLAGGDYPWHTRFEARYDPTI